jgi:ribonuclease R
MRSAASLAYERAQAIEDGDEKGEPVADAVRHLFGAYRSLARAREARAPLHLDLPERRIELDEAGTVTSVKFRERFDAHRLIEEMMILANVCAAETLESLRRPLLYRVHEEPATEKIDALREQMETVGLTLAKGQVLKTRHLNTLLDAAADSEFAELVNMSVLRAQTQAYYSPQNFGHFGLNLRSYAHFTSPIRRYADLIVHRALIAGHGWGRDGQTAEEIAALPETAELVSRTERRAMEAERDTTDRYLAAYLSERLGAEFEGRVSGVAKFGLFVKLDETGADGFVPMSTLGSDFFVYDEARHAVIGRRTGEMHRLGDRVEVKLVEAAPLAGALRFELLSEGRTLPKKDRPAEDRPRGGRPAKGGTRGPSRRR